jgi:hypothetical protein
VSDLACAIHVHSRHSDGSGTIPDIAAAAARAQLDAVLITDHDTLAGTSEEGWYGDVLVLVGVELSPKRRDHYLVFGLDELIPHAGTDAAAMCAAVDDAGGFGFAAHPRSAGSAMPVVRRAARPQPWADLDEPCITGIELWNVETEGAERARTPQALARFARDPLGLFPEPDPRMLALWDRLGARRRVVGIAGLDAHAKGLRLGRRSLSPLPYARLFRHARTHVITAEAPAGDLEQDRRLVLAALRHGRCYVAIDAIAPARGFAFGAANGRRVLAMGDEADAGGWTLRATTPVDCALALIRDGRIVVRASGRSLEASAHEAGVYRVEARRDGRLWILSNPIYLR